jgi:hypothetical protein
LENKKLIRSAIAWDDGHQGGRFDAKVLQRERMLRDNLSKVAVLGVTEAVGLPNISGHKKVGHECKVYYNTTLWKLKDSGVLVLNTNRWVRGKSARRSVEVQWVLLENTSGWTLLRFIGHLPAHLYLLWQKRANTKALRQLGPGIKKLAKKLNPTEIDLSLDLNRDLRLEKNVTLVKKSLEGTGLHLIVPPKGTLKKRKIDMLASTATNRGPVKMFEKHPGYDHTGYYSDLAS